ncbi:hypothetical protein CC78DRAFT_568339 [Lojkania enalia]|uniref:AA1-like domain-containing protein n=1 Tax=Lojkania enalia TaxID=147567 RepID=A0A9P4N8D7_9PLEO|nr:hypothetical protein CC78DRAFT_568339 [Didymosphaeria enalia]
MHFVTDTILALVSGLAIAIPSPPLLSRDELALHVSQFGAFLSNDSRIPSHVSFHVVDSHPDHPGETNCVFVTQDSHSLFGSGWMISSCDPGLEFDFYLRQDSMKLSRLFYMDPADNNCSADRLVRSPCFQAGHLILVERDLRTRLHSGDAQPYPAPALLASGEMLRGD